MDEGTKAEGDALRRLEERLQRASDAAERLIAEAASTVSGRAAGQPPPAGWQAPREAGDPSGARDDLALLTDLFGRVRDLIPPELQQRLGEALRELLLAVRALIDWYLDRLDRRRAEPAEVTDIPIL